MKKSLSIILIIICLYCLFPSANAQQDEEFMVISFFVEDNIWGIIDVDIYLDSFKLGTFKRGDTCSLLLFSESANETSPHHINIISERTSIGIASTEFIYMPSHTLSFIITNHWDNISVDKYNIKKGFENLSPDYPTINLDNIYNFTESYGGRAYSTKRSRIDEYYFFDFSHNIMACVSVIRDHGKEKTHVNANRIEVESEGKIHWLDKDGTPSKGYYLINGNYLCFYDKNGKKLMIYFIRKKLVTPK